MTRNPGESDINVDAQLLDKKRQVEDDLFSYDNVVTVGVGKKNDTDEECIVVGVTEKLPESVLHSDQVIPKEVGGYKTDVQEVGEIVPEIPEPQLDRMARHRPVPQGVSVAHPDVTAGSTGWMYQTGDGAIFIGSNNHVLAASNEASVGDGQLQPGPADGGVAPDDEIGTLAYYVPVENNVNVDLALVEVSVETENSLAEMSSPIVGSVESLSVGDELVKSGRTTGVTRGSIQQLDASISIDYGGTVGSITVTGCIITDDMSEGGDSGSPTALETGSGIEAAGRLFAGSDSVTVHHHILSELDHLVNDFDTSIQLMTGEEAPPTANVSLVLEKDAQDSTGTIHVTVDDGGGAPVPSATVEISGAASDSATTGTDGTVTFSAVPIGDFTISASKEGYISASTSIVSGDFQ